MHLVLSDLQGMLLCGAEHLAFSLASTYPSLIFVLSGKENLRTCIAMTLRFLLASPAVKKGKP